MSLILKAAGDIMAIYAFSAIVGRVFGGFIKRGW